MSRLIALVVSIILASLPLTAQEQRAELWLQVRIGNVYGLPGLVVSAQSTTKADPYAMTVRVRASGGSIECLNEHTVWPAEDAADIGDLTCINMGDVPPLASVQGVTAEVTGSLFSSRSYRCSETERTEAIITFACNTRRERTEGEATGSATEGSITPTAGEGGENSGGGAGVLALLAVLAIPFIVIGGILAVVPPWLTILVVAVPALLFLDRIERQRLERREES